MRTNAVQWELSRATHVVVGYISNQDLWRLMNSYCLLAMYLVVYVDAPGDLA